MTPNVSLPMYDLPEMWADNARFGEALRGLLRAHDWGLITVEFSEREDGIWLSVEDIGIGMSEAVLTGSLLDFGAPPGWSRDFPASRRKEWFPLDQVWYRLFLCGAVPIRSLWFLPDSRGAVPRPSTSLEDIGYVRGHIRRISVRMGRKIWASRFVHKAGCQNARHGSSPQLQRRQLCVTEAVNDMVIDHPSRLHKSVANRRSYELKAALSQILAHRIRFFGGAWNVAHDPPGILDRRVIDELPNISVEAAEMALHLDKSVGVHDGSFDL